MGPFDVMLRLALLLLSVLLATWRPLSEARADAAAPGDRLAAGIAALDAKPPDPSAARAAFLDVARGTDDRAAAEALYRLAQLEETAYDFKAAVAHYEASAKRLPSGRRSPHAQSRASDLRAHAEGDFVPLTILERVRRTPDQANDPAAIDALVRASATFPVGRVRVEARMLAAEAYAGRLRRPNDALPLLEAVIDDPKAEVLMAREATSELLAAYEARQDYARAEAVIAAHPKLAPPGADKALHRLRRRRIFRGAARVDLALLAAFGLLAFRANRRRRARLAVEQLAPTACVFAGFAAGVGGLLASRYEQTNPYPFAAMFPATFTVILLARAWSATGSASGVARAGRATTSFLASSRRRSSSLTEWTRPISQGSGYEGTGIMKGDTRQPVPHASIRVLRLGHGANCSSIGSVVDTLFVTSLLGGALFASIVAALANEPIDVIGDRPEPKPATNPRVDEEKSP